MQKTQEDEMEFTEGNTFWQTRSSSGRRPVFQDPNKLEEACEEYFRWVEANPLKEERATVSQGEVIRYTINKMRAMTIDGLCLFLDISTVTWRTYRANPEFEDVINRVDNVIRTQKFTGAAADLLNPNVIIRDLGLADKKEHTGNNGGPVMAKVEWQVIDPLSQAQDS